MSLDKLDKLLKPLIKNAIKLAPRANPTAGAVSCKSKFGGKPYAEAGDTWPACPTCKKELTFINQIRDNSEDTMFVFYYCNDCFPWGFGKDERGQWLAKLYDSPTIEKCIDISRQTEDKSAPRPCEAIASSVMVLPDWEGIGEISEEVVELCSELNTDEPWEAYDEAVSRAGCVGDYATLLGGYPRFVQGANSMSCPQCGKRMEFYAQVDSEDEANIMWGDVGLVYFFRCPEHKKEFLFELQCH